jgi:hypothetical protein
MQLKRARARSDRFGARQCAPRTNSAHAPLAIGPRDFGATRRSPATAGLAGASFAGKRLAQRLL